MHYFETIWNYVELALGFGFVVFFHELGHFLAAKYCDVKVEQFAVGFGPAIVSWRKKIGFRWGSTSASVDKLIDTQFGARVENSAEGAEKPKPTSEQSSALAREMGIGETEYRLNWIPLGGYVKMLGQDDLRPEATSSDPRSYNSKPIRSRMLIVSAGVIMNVILAAVGFMIVYRIGYPVPPAIVGSVLTDSPAAMATDAAGKRVGLQSGDQIVKFNGHSTVGDFTKVQLNTALTAAGETVPIVVRHLDGKQQTLYIKPAKPNDNAKALSAIGIAPAMMLQAAPAMDQPMDSAAMKEGHLSAEYALQPGDVITRINGKDVKPNQYWKLDDALNDSHGLAVQLTIRSASGKTRTLALLPHLQTSFTGADINFMGLAPGTEIADIDDKSAALGKVHPGDFVVRMVVGSDPTSYPTPSQFRDIIATAAAKEIPVELTLIGAGESKPHDLPGIVPSESEGGRRVLGVALEPDADRLIVAQTLPDSAADQKIPAGARITEIDRKPVSNWIQVRDAVAHASANKALAVTFIPPGGDPAPRTELIVPTAADITAAQTTYVSNYLLLAPMSSSLKTTNLLEAMKLGAIETRDLILQFYLTLQRMLTGTVGINNMMGPVGMLQAGGIIAARGTSWLLWFLANISANLAVVNFLPIPIVDGGLFTLLVLEAIQGKPFSPDAQKIVQVVGLVLILFVFLLVTYQDIARMFGYGN